MKPNLFLTLLSKHSVPATVNLITNGTFDTDTAWTKGSGWTISGGTANASVINSELSQALSLIEGHTYRLTYTVVISSGDFVAYSRETMLTYRDASGTYQESFVATALDDYIAFSSNGSNFTGTLDDVLLEDIT